jgi:TrmH family RNA methyltransferase
LEGYPIIFMKAAMDNVRVVLVGIRNAGNIGSSARAMKNMGVKDLFLVNPPPYDTPEVRNLGWGADDLIDTARTADSINDAVTDCGLVIGTTRRIGRFRRPVYPLRSMLGRIAEATTNNRVALLFGRENKGLSNEELDLCQFSVSIATAGIMPSLNVSQAVLTVCYELFMFDRRSRESVAKPMVSHGELVKLYARLDKALQLLGYGDKGDRKVLRSTMRTLQRIFARSGLTTHELNALHGLCQQIERSLALRE